MEIMKVLGELVCTQRVEGFGHMHLRILQNNKGKKLVALDPVGAREGNQVFTTTGTAARSAAGSSAYPSDLTIVGIIDHWDPENIQKQGNRSNGNNEGFREISLYSKS